jgi:putative heme-binding domain-containing protein
MGVLRPGSPQRLGQFDSTLILSAAALRWNKLIESILGLELEREFEIIDSGGMEALPLLVTVLPLFVSLTFSAALAAYPAQEKPEPTSARPAKKAPSQPAVGQRSFESHCASCHGLDGRGGEHAHGIATPRAAGALEDPALFQIIRGGIPSQGMPSFDSLSEPEIHAIITYLRLLTGKSAVRPLKGNSIRGEQLFFEKARCGVCHMMRGKGGFIGSDLTDFAASHSVDELHRAIINPDQWIPPARNVVTVTTLSQERVTGMVRNQDNFSLQVQDADGVFHLFLKSQITKVDREAHSLMPGDYGTRLTPAELDDLIGFLFGGAPAPAPGSTGAGPSARRQAAKKSLKRESN